MQEAGETKHLLLGNGFSIACRPNVFRYDTLFNQADFSKLPNAKKAFDALGTKNFEFVIRALRSYAHLEPIYSRSSSAPVGSADDDANSLREILVTAVAQSHPDRPHELSAQEFIRCRRFLREFKSINSLNYDLLLYWTLMQDELGDAPIPCDDGFRKPADDKDADYVSWDPDNSKSQNIRYLHGALHLYDTGFEMKKFTWVDSQIPLIDQIRAALHQDFYPVFVSEGTSKEKVDRIRHNDYLCKMYRSFTEIQGSLVIYGHSLDESDDHIFKDRIGRHGKTKTLYISVFGDPKSNDNQKKIKKALNLSNLRPEKRPLEVKFYSAESTSIWK